MSLEYCRICQNRLARRKVFNCYL